MQRGRRRQCLVGARISRTPCGPPISSCRKFPEGVDFTMSIRRAVRAGASDGALIEDGGVVGQHYDMTGTDILQQQQGSHRALRRDPRGATMDADECETREIRHPGRDRRSRSARHLCRPAIRPARPIGSGGTASTCSSFGDTKNQMVEIVGFAQGTVRQKRRLCAIGGDMAAPATVNAAGYFSVSRAGAEPRRRRRSHADCDQGVARAWRPDPDADRRRDGKDAQGKAWRTNRSRSRSSRAICSAGRWAPTSSNSCGRCCVPYRPTKWLRSMRARRQTSRPYSPQRPTISLRPATLRSSGTISAISSTAAGWTGRPASLALHRIRARRSACPLRAGAHWRFRPEDARLPGQAGAHPQLCPGQCLCGRHASRRQDQGACGPASKPGHQDRKARAL